MFNVNFDHIITLLLTFFFRKPKFQGYLQSLIAPMKSIYVQFIDFRWVILNKIQYTGQVVYMQKILNDTFNLGGQSLIWIDDGMTIDQEYLYTRPESRPKLLYTRGENLPLYLYTRAEYIGTYSFKVMVPALLYATISTNGQLQQLIAMIEFYKLAGKSYIIETY